MDAKMRGLQSAHIEVDEIWGSIGAKRKNADRTGNYGGVWTFIAIDADTKVIPSFVVGKRDGYHADAFIAEAESHAADALPPVDPPHERIQQKIGKF